MLTLGLSRAAKDKEVNDVMALVNNVNWNPFTSGAKKDYNLVKSKKFFTPTDTQIKTSVIQSVDGRSILPDGTLQ